jgi:S1-C subfamily serine protease
MGIHRRRMGCESGIADVLAIVLVALLATFAIVALVDATQDSTPKRLAPRETTPAPARLDADAVARRIVPAVVAIDAALESGGRSAGTGMVLTPSGQVLTNNHVIARATSVTVRTHDNQTFPARVVGYDIADDVAVLQTDGASGLRTIDVGISATVTPGQPVAVLDGDRGVHASVRALARDVTAGDDRDPAGIDARQDVVELAAAMQPADAGGPVADARGNVIAMRTAASAGRRFHEETAPEVSFAVPIDRARAIVGQINSGRSTATVHVGPRAALGADVGTLPNGGSGVLVVDVQRDGPAAGAGIVSDDVIAAVDNVSVASPADFESALNRHQAGDEVRVGWFDARRVYRTATVRLTEGAPA